VKETLFIRLGDGERATWLRDNEPTQVSEGALLEAAALASGRQVAVVVPGADVVLASVAVPTRNRSRMAAAVPYLLEEQLATDVDDAHFALGERDSDGRVAVAVVSRKRMDEWLARLAEAGIHADKLIPDTLLLPYQAGEWALLFEADCVNLRSAVQGGMAMDASNAVFMVQRALGELEVKPERMHAWFAEGIPAAVLPDDLGVETDGESLPGHPLSFLAAQVQGAGVINLLQGPYSRSERLSKAWRPWRPAAVLLAVWLVLQFGINVFHYQRLRGEEAHLREAVNQIYLQTFPDAKRVVNARVQMEQHLNALRGGDGDVGDFIKLLSAVSGPTASLGSVSIDHLSYKDGEVNLALTIPDLQHLDQYKDNLSKETHMTVVIQSATTRANGVDARLQVKGGRS